MRMFMPVKVLIGENCVLENARLFGSFGNRAIIVTGPTSGKASGALDDVVRVFEELGTEWTVYDRVLNNPTVLNAYDIGMAAKEAGAGFIVGIGGGSPLDAAKAAAVYAANDMEPMEVYGDIKNRPLPVVAIPTTAGTGSEVTPYSVLTVDSKRPKVSLKSDWIFPALAFLDRRYTKSLPSYIAVYTALDAMSHAVESILCKRNSYISEFMAREALRIIGAEIGHTAKPGVPDTARERLLYASMLAGVAIAHTGTTIVHSMGYSLTYFKGMQHGLANGALLPAFMRRADKYAPAEAAKVFGALGVSGIEEFEGLISGLLPEIPVILREEAAEFAALSIKNPNVLQNLWSISENDEAEIFMEACG